jgi:phage terminase large subunit-like protein
VELPKKQGKSELAAAIALYLLIADGEQAAEIYGCANDRKQAGIVFDVARDMVLMNPTLKKVCKIVESQKRIIFLPTRSYYSAMSAEVSTKYGLNVHGCIFDELLGQRDRELYDVMTSGSGAARKQPLNFVITTAGRDRTSVCWDMHMKALDIMEGRKVDSTFYPVVYTAPDDCDWTSEEVWKAVCPSLGKTVTLEFMRNQCESAKQDAAEEMNFRQFFLCQWVYAPVRWLPMDKYDLGADPIDMDALKKRKCYGGLDLAATTDIAAFVLMFPPENDDDKYILLPFFWIPGENIPKRVKNHHVPYDTWAKGGHLNATDGYIIQYDFIEQKIIDLRSEYDIEAVAYDEWGAHQMIQRLERLDGIEYVAMRQGYKSLSPPSKEMMRLVLDEKIQHGGHPVLRWMFNNVFIETDAAGNIKPSKEKASENFAAFFKRQ